MMLSKGRRVLVVEDESLIAMLVEDVLLDLGCDVTVAMRLDRGLELARRTDIEVAVLDINLGEGCSYPIADVLRERGIPFAFATGYGARGVDAGYRDVPVLQKPYRPADLVALLERVMTPEGDCAGGVA
jgi:DNA-binding response OmpR family regulator